MFRLNLTRFPHESDGPTIDGECERWYILQWGCYMRYYTVDRDPRNVLYGNIMSQIEQCAKTVQHGSDSHNIHHWRVHLSK